MPKRALLIGSQTGGLSGVNNDVNAVADRLSDWGFTTELCTGQSATRQGIMERYLNLIEETQPGDAVVVYYSGHGGYAANPDYQPMTAAGAVAPRYYQFIVPVDIEETTDGDFRGITSLELSTLLARLTQKTINATVILDCCHAARMSRDVNLLPKAWPRPWFVGIAAHLKKLAEEGLAADGRHMESNPNAVRLVAAAPEQSAYEYTNAPGKRVGLLTESFLIALEQAQGQRVSWRSLGARIRERVLSVVPYQRPEVEGPAGRLLFDTDTADLTGVLPVIKRGGKPMLQGGRLLGIHVDDVYAVVPMGVEKPAPESQIAQATVESVAGAVSAIRLEYYGKHTAVPEGANAFPISTALPKRPVKLSADGDEREKLIQAIQASQFVRVAGQEDPAEVLAEVVVAEGRLDLRDTSGLSLVEPKSFNDKNEYVAVVYGAVSNLERFARVQALLNLRSGEGASALDTPYRVEWGRVVDGKAQPLAQTGDLVFVGEPVYVRVVNAGQARIYFTLFDLGVGGKITLLTTSEPSGIGLEPGEDYVFGHEQGVGLIGVKPGWPPGIPDNAPRRESLVVISSDRPQDLRALEQEGMRGAEGPRTSPLQEMVEQIAWGGTRDFSAEHRPDPDLRYAVSRIDFQLDPNPAPTQDKGTFLIDERRELSTQLRLLEAKGQAPSDIAIRLKDLIVHHNRALASTEIRVDAIVVTGPTNGDSSSLYRLETARFTRIKDGDRLPFDNLLVYHGPVAYFLDMAVWVSRNQKDSLSLAELFKTELNSTEFKTAATVLAGLAIAAPQAALAVGAVGASATLVNIGTKLLLKAVGNSIGLYRTSYLPFEQFGVGQHPTNGLMQAQDFSFGYEIIAID